MEETNPTVAETADLTPFVLGPPLNTNCYVLKDRGSDACWIIDAGYEPDTLIEYIQANDLSPERILLTHAHADHIAGLLAVRSALGPVPILLHEAEHDWLNDPVLNLSDAIGLAVTGPAPDDTLSDGQTLTLGNDTWTVLHTPGHSPGGVSFYCEALATVIAGDTLFNGSIGRSDFPGSSFETLAEAIKTKLYTLPEHTRVFPGHGPPTTIGQERDGNPFVRA